MEHDFATLLQLLVQAECFTRIIYNHDGFPCADYDQCSGCDHALVSGVTRTGFPFQLESELEKGGFSRVIKGAFHRGQAAFKFVKINETGFQYDDKSIGAWLGAWMAPGRF